MTTGDTDITIASGFGPLTLEVVSKASSEGVMVRTWGPEASMIARHDMTADEALALAQALITAATTSIRFRAGLPAKVAS